MWININSKSLSIALGLLALSFAACGGENEPALYSAATRVKALIDAGDTRTDVPTDAATQAIDQFMGSIPPDRDIKLFHQAHLGGGTHRFSTTGQSPQDVAEITVNGLHLVDKHAVYFDTFELDEGQILSDALSQGRVKFLTPPVNQVSGLRGLSETVHMGSVFDRLSNMEPIDMFRSGAGFYVEDLIVDHPRAANMQCRFCGLATDPQTGQIHVAFEAFSMKGDVIAPYSMDMEFSLSRFSISDLRLPKIEFETTDPSRVDTAQMLTQVNPFRPHFGSMSGRDIIAGYPDFRIAIPSLDITETTDGSDKFTRTVSLPDMTVDFRDSSEANVDLKLLELKLDPLNLSYQREGEFDRAGDSWQETIEIRSDNGFELRTVMELTGVNRSLSALIHFIGNADVDDPAALATSRNGWNDLALNSFTLELNDTGLRDRVITLLADRNNQSVQETRAQYASMASAPILLAQSEYQGALVMAWADVAEDFIEQGGTLKITVRPDGGSYKIRPLMENYAQTIWKAMAGQKVEPIDYDAVLKALNIEFSHLPD